MTTTAQAEGPGALVTPRESTNPSPVPARAAVLVLACTFAALAGCARRVGPGGLGVGLLAWRLGTAPTWRRVVAAGALLALGLLVAGSRVWLGVHYPSDVAGGLALGTTWVVGACQVRAGWGRRAARVPADTLPQPH